MVNWIAPELPIPWMKSPMSDCQLARTGGVVGNATLDRAVAVGSSSCHEIKIFATGCDGFLGSGGCETL